MTKAADQFQRTSWPSKGRLEAFSDGEFAVAITLLVLDIRLDQPTAPGTLAAGLGDLKIHCAAYAISFLTIGVMWVNRALGVSRDDVRRGFVQSGSGTLVYVAALAVSAIPPYVSPSVFAVSVVVFAVARPARSAVGVSDDDGA